MGRQRANPFGLTCQFPGERCNIHNKQSLFFAEFVSTFAQNLQLLAHASLASVYFSCNSQVYTAVLQPHERIMGLDLAHGGEAAIV